MSLIAVRTYGKNFNNRTNAERSIIWNVSQQARYQLPIHVSGERHVCIIHNVHAGRWR